MAENAAAKIAILVIKMDIFRHMSVLVLDDDHLCCVLTQETLRLIGFVNVYTACSSVAGTRILDHHRPELVLMDVDRYRSEIWSALAQGPHRSTLVIATSFNSNDRYCAKGCSADAFLAKPYSKSRLLQTITRLLTSTAGRRCKVVPLVRPGRPHGTQPEPLSGAKATPTR